MIWEYYTFLTMSQQTNAIIKNTNIESGQIILTKTM